MTTQTAKVARHFKVWFQDGQTRVCRGCSEKTTSYELIVTSNFKDWYHDYCFAAPEFIRLDKTNSNVRVKVKANLVKANNRMEDHNAKSRLGGLQVFNMKEYAKRCDFELSSDKEKKILGKIFVFLRGEELAGKVSLVCRKWYSISWLDKFWLKLIAKLPPIATCAPSELPAKQRFISISKFLCLRCSKFLREDEVGIVCPFYKRALCVPCRNFEAWRLISIPDFCRINKLKPSFGKTHFRMEGISMNKVDFGYLGALNEKLYKLRAAHRDAMIQKLQSQYKASAALVKEIRALSLNKDPDDIEVMTSKYGPLFSYILELQSPGALTKALQCVQGAVKCRQKKGCVVELEEDIVGND